MLAYMPKHVLPIISAALVVLFFWLFSIYPAFIYIAVGISAALVSAAIYLLTQEGGSWKQRWQFFILPNFWLLSMAFYMSLVSSDPLLYGLWAVNGVFIFLNLRLIYFFFNHTETGIQANLNNFTAYGSFLTVFFAASAMYGLQSFLDFPVWMLLTSWLVFLFFLIYQLLWMNKIEEKSAILFSLIDSLIILELAWCLFFLPVANSVMGMTLALYYYIILGLTRPLLNDSLNKRMIKIYILFGLGCSILVLLTARWK